MITNWTYEALKEFKREWGKEESDVRKPISMI